MSDKNFKRFLIILIALLMLFTIAHMAYAVRVYRNSSIISYIAKEIW